MLLTSYPSPTSPCRAAEVYLSGNIVSVFVETSGTSRAFLSVVSYFAILQLEGISTAYIEGTAGEFPVRQEVDGLPCQLWSFININNIGIPHEF